MKRKLLTCALACAFYTACDSTGVGNPPRNPDPVVLETNEEALIADGDEGTRAGDGGASIIAIPLLTLKEPQQITSSDGAAGISQLAAAYYFSPMGCATAAREANVVTWTFTECGGRFGVAGLSGKLIVTYTSTTGGLELKYKSEALTLEKLEGLTVQRASVDFQATASLSFVGTTRKVVWNGTYGVTLPLKQITHVASYDTSLEEGCVDLDGTSTTTLSDARGTRTLISTWVGYRRCGEKKACPEPGGMLTIEAKPSGFVVRIKLLGGQSIEVTSSSRPKPVVVDKLQCIP